MRVGRIWQVRSAGPRESGREFGSGDHLLRRRLRLLSTDAAHRAADGFPFEAQIDPARNPRPPRRRRACASHARGATCVLAPSAPGRCRHFRWSGDSCAAEAVGLASSRDRALRAIPLGDRVRVSVGRRPQSLVWSPDTLDSRPATGRPATKKPAELTRGGLDPYQCKGWAILGSNQ